MGKQMTEMLKGTLEGIVLAILAVQPAYGYEITAWLESRGSPTSPKAPLRAARQGRAAGLVDVEKVPSEKGPPRKVYPSTIRDREYLEEFWKPGASSRNDSDNSAKKGTSHGGTMDSVCPHGSLEDKKRYRAHKARVNAGLFPCPRTCQPEDPGRRRRPAAGGRS